jgi:hypothetical protein
MNASVVDDDTTDHSIIWNDVILFGGAIWCKLPMGYMDLAHVRQVPDNQECYMEMHFGDDSDDKPSSVFIMEILEHQESVEHDQVIEYLFRDLAASNGIGETDDIVWEENTEHNHQPRMLYFQSDDSSDTSTTIGITPPHELFDLDTPTMGASPSSNTSTTVICRSGRGIQRLRRGKDSNVTTTTNANMETILIQLFVFRLVEQRSDVLVTLNTPIITSSDHNNSFDLVMQQQQQQTRLFQKMISSIQIHDLTLFNP